MKRLKKRLIDILEKELISFQKDNTHFAVFRDDTAFYLVYDDHKKWYIIKTKTNIGFVPLTSPPIYYYNLCSITFSILGEFIELVKNEKIKKYIREKNL